MKYNFDEAIERRNTYCIKWDGGAALKFDRFDKDTIPMFIADMDFACPQPIIEALHKVADHKIIGYTGYAFVPEYYDAIVRWFGSRRNWRIKPDEITYVSGTMEAIKIAVRAFTKPGDGIIIQPPIYSPFLSVPKDTGRKSVSNRLINDNGYYSIDFKDLENKVKDPGNSMLLLCNPHNPVGRIFTDDELKRVARLCRDNGVIIVADEIHGDLVRRDSAFHPIASVVDNRNIVTCTATTKNFNLAGLQCTNVVIADPELRSAFQKEASEIVGPGQSPFSIASLIAGYTQGDEWMDQVNDYIDGNIDWVLGFLKERMPKVRCRRPEGTYFLWMDFRGYGLTDAEIHDRIVKRANVLLGDGSHYDPEEGGGFIRACIPTRRALVQEAFKRIADAFEDA